MKRISSLFLCVTMFTWLLPLGAFIKPSQQKEACDGQRPFHMCSMAAKSAAKALPSGIALTSSGGVEKAPKAPAGDGAQIGVSVHPFDESALRPDSLRFFDTILPFSANLYRLDAVPKRIF